MPNNSADLLKEQAAKLGVPVETLDPLAEILNRILRSLDKSGDLVKDDHVSTLGLTSEESP